MSSFVSELLSLCAAAAAIEILAGLFSESGTLRFVRSLCVLAVVVSGISSAAGADRSFLNAGAAQYSPDGALSEYIEGETLKVGEQELEDYINGLLAAAGIEAKKISLGLNIADDKSIELKKLSCGFEYESDAERAYALLKNVLGDETEVEVYADGS